VRTIRLTVSYDGTEFAGFQFQAGARTVQEALEGAVARITGVEARVQAAGRTDAGVHATGQVVSFRTESRLPPRELQRALNGVLPEDVAVVTAGDAPDGFHARFSAVARGYRYTIWNAPDPLILGRRYALHWRAFLDVPAMVRCSQVLVGHHDFAAFSGSLRGRERPTTTSRTIYRLHPWRNGGWVYVDVAANAFLPRMVRNLVGTLMQTGLHETMPEAVERALFAGTRTGAAITAPPHGLCLTNVWYD